MLFVMVIDVLDRLIHCAIADGLLQRLTPCHMASSISLYGDDVVIFFNLDDRDLTAVRELLRAFGIASGQHTNFAKCSASPIQCSIDDRSGIQRNLDCPIADFPARYLGLPLSIRKIPSSALQPIIDKLERKLSPWWVTMLSRGERLAMFLAPCPYTS
jgi:hypothetical protein